MNKVILMGRLVREPETRYTQGPEPITVTKYTLAVNRKFKRQGETDADFINCVAFGKAGEFAEKYFTKGLQVAVGGRMQVRNWEDKEGRKRVSTDVIVEEQFFADKKKEKIEEEGFYPVDESMDEDLPF